MLRSEIGCNGRYVRREGEVPGELGDREPSQAAGVYEDMGGRIKTLVAVLPLLAPGLAFACTCMQMDDGLTNCQRLQKLKSNVLFLGNVVSLHQVSDGKSLARINIVTLSVHESFRGPSEKTIVVRTYATPGLCGFPFEQGKTYLVDASGTDENLWTDSCSFTRDAEFASNDIRFIEMLKGSPH